MRVGTASTSLLLHLPRPAQGKTAHRPLKFAFCPLPWQPAQERASRGTRGVPLSAAWFPA